MALSTRPYRRTRRYFRFQPDTHRAQDHITRHPTTAIFHFTIRYCLETTYTSARPNRLPAGAAPTERLRRIHTSAHKGTADLSSGRRAVARPRCDALLQFVEGSAGATPDLAGRGHGRSPRPGAPAQSRMASVRVAADRDARGGAYDVVHSPASAVAAHNARRAAGDHDSRSRLLTHPERTRAEVRRDYASLAPAHARRADAILVPSAYTAQ